MTRNGHGLSKLSTGCSLTVEMNQPLAIDLFAGLGGWAAGLLAEGYYVVGFDIIRHVYGSHRYPAQLVIQDVRTLHGSQFKDATLIVASPPCQAYSYRAMPWKRAKALPPPDNTLFETCFRIQREANLANNVWDAAGHCAACMGTGNFYGRDEDGDYLPCDDCGATGYAKKRYIPLIVENVRGAQKWVGRARWSFGSFYLWGDVPALMPPTLKAVKNPGLNWSAHADPDYRTSGKGACFRDSAITSGKGQNPDGRKKVPGFRFNGNTEQPSGSFQTASVRGLQCGGQSGEQSGDGRTALGIGTASSGEDTSGSPPLTNCPTTSGDAGDAVEAGRSDGIKQHGSGQAWWDQALDDRRKEATAMMREDGTKVGGGRDGWFGDNHGPLRRHHSGSTSRKFASAIIAKIPLPLSRHIARTFYPR
jgi:C-5 cytosine-specific DNA methylase